MANNITKILLNFNFKLKRKFLYLERINPVGHVTLY